MIVKQLVYPKIRQMYHRNVFAFLPEKVKQRQTTYSSSMPTPNQLDCELTNKWTSQLHQDTPLSLLSIPGTHDSVTYSSSTFFQLCFASQCQSWSILAQLQSGIRYFDLRVRYDLKGELITHHGPVQFENFLVIVMQIASFLQDNPQEFIIAAFQGIIGLDPSAKILQMFRKHKVPVLLSKKIPTVKEARGKVWIYSGFNIDFNDSTFEMLGEEGVKDIKGKYYLQNCYTLRKIFPIEMKVQQMMKAAFGVEDDAQRMKINFLSASGLGIIELFRWLPHKLAFHQQGPNAVLYKQLNSMTRKAILGVTIMDFPSNSLIESIIKTNTFKH